MEAKEYQLINVMETLVKEKAQHFMTEIGMCTCPRCEIDVVALALSGVAPKYVVAETAEVSPLMNFYASKYEGSIAIELMKAGELVRARPRH